MSESKNKFLRYHCKKSQLRCGACGGEDHKLFSNETEDGAIMVLCNGCSTESHIGVSKPKITIDWVENSSGLLTKF